LQYRTKRTLIRCYHTVPYIEKREKDMPQIRIRKEVFDLLAALAKRDGKTISEEAAHAFREYMKA
jgi:hypothetical protein